MMAFCIKNYEAPTGLSTQIHSEDQNDSLYEIKGPMGHGLRPKSEGLHMAFAAGTGVLCFVDYVASLIQDRLDLHGNDSNFSRKHSNFSTKNMLKQLQGKVA